MDPEMLSPAQAQHLIVSHVPSLSTISAPLTQLAGAVLREDIRVPRDQPPFDRVTMDGIALASTGYVPGKSLKIAGTQAAGRPPLALSGQHSCLEVMTGAMLPTGCDCVVPVEKIAVQDGSARVADDVGITPWLNIHRRGTDARAGDLLVCAGTRLGAAEIAAIAAVGLTHVAVAREPRIIVISTGDELIEPGSPVTDWQIYRSNVYGVMAALQRRGYHSTQDHLPDDLPQLRARLQQHLQQNDVLILSGGVSMGRFDFVPQALADLGVKMLFHKIAQRPGKPMWFGIGPQGQAVYALPGNPVSTLTCLIRYVLRGLDAAAGIVNTPQRAQLERDFTVKPALTFFVPSLLRQDDAGRLTAALKPTQGSGDFISLLGTDGFVELDAGPRTAAAGEIVAVYRW